MCRVFLFFFFFFKQKTAYEIRLSLVGSEMCIRDRVAGLACSSLTTQGSAVRTRHRPPRKSPGQRWFFQPNRCSERALHAHAFRICSASRLETMLALFPPERSDHAFVHACGRGGKGAQLEANSRHRGCGCGSPETSGPEDS